MLEVLSAIAVIGAAVLATSGSLAIFLVVHACDRRVEDHPTRAGSRIIEVERTKPLHTEPPIR